MNDLNQWANFFITLVAIIGLVIYIISQCKQSKAHHEWMKKNDELNGLLKKATKKENNQ